LGAVQEAQLAAAPEALPEAAAAALAALAATQACCAAGANRAGQTRFRTWRPRNPFYATSWLLGRPVRRCQRNPLFASRPT
ncbi:MAG: hypothetical protein ABL883_09800, partial [Terricaulis sp.]